VEALVLLDSPEQPVSLDLQAVLELQARPVLPVLLEHLVQLVQLELSARPVLTAHLARTALLDRREGQELAELQGRQALLEQPDPLDRKAALERVELLVPAEHLELPARQVHPE